MTMPRDARIEVIPEGYYAAGTTVEIRPRSSGVVALFDKTPEGICCPHFWRLSLGQNCRFSCAYCYLQGGTSHRLRKAEGKEKIPVVFANLAGMKAKVERWLSREEKLT